MIAMTYNNMYI